MKVLLYIWQLPQHLLALLLLLIYKRTLGSTVSYKSSTVYFLNNSAWGISLGQYIILSQKYHNLIDIRHEYGHSIQSKRWGILYLLVVGLPSITMNIVSSLTYRTNPTFYNNYYKRWPETEADKLGEVTRN